MHAAVPYISMFLLATTYIEKKCALQIEFVG
jgi:hypothetical protein